VFNTIDSAFKTADDPDNVYMGVACITDKIFFDELISFTSNLPNVYVDWHDPKHSLGIGKGRSLSRKRYGGQDNILQVDSHTLFRNSWDTILKSLWDECLQETKNNKTVMTAYLPRYKVSNNERMVDGGQSRYAPFLGNNRSMPNGVLNWGDVPVSEFPVKNNNRLLPSNKINANFIFSNKFFVENSGLPENAVFFDEEIIQSIELLSSKFSLVFPNTTLPLHHLYHPDQDEFSDSRQAQPFSFEEIDLSMKQYIDDRKNLWKCRMWEEYAHANLRQGEAEPWYIPKEFSWSAEK
jgi:hypothetical protein